MSKFIFTKEKPLRVCTLCSGYDSQCMALDKLGIPYELKVWSEIDKYAIQAHNAVYPQNTNDNAGDMTKIDWSEQPDFDLLTYSTPCQDISMAGKQAGLVEGTDTRSSIIWYTKHAIQEKKPKYLLGENVKNLVGCNHRPEYFRWLQFLEFVGRDESRNARWKVQCDCGTIFEVKASAVKSGTTYSCGCLRKENNKNRHKH